MIEECVQGVTPKMSANLADRPARGQAHPASEIAAAANQAAHDWASQKLLPRCLQWLHAEGHWPEAGAEESFARQELAAALQHAPPFQPMLPEPVPVLPLSSWVITAGLGALLGMLPCALLGWALTGQREAGLVLGGILGAMGLVLAVGLIASAPAVRSAITYALALSSAGTVLGGLWAYWKKESTASWLRGAVGVAVGWVVVLLARPRLDWPARDAALAGAQEQLRGHLRYLADLLLAWCWAHPMRAPQAGARKPAPQDHEPLSASVYRLLADLHLRVASNADSKGLQDAVEVLLQRLEDAGYEWKAVPPGTPYDEAMRKEFESFGRLEPGQKVRTRRPSLHLNGKLVQPGELQRE
jgi:hypothetical protein